MTIHLFILQALVSAAMYTKVKQGGGPENQRISYEDLHDQTHFLSQLFRGEFIFPTEGLDVNLARTIDTLERDNVIKVTRDATTHKVLTVELSDAERETGRENFDFYCFLIWPFIEAAWLGAISLTMLTPPLTHSGDVFLSLKATQDRSQLLGKTLYHQGDLSYFEAVNKETLKNAYERFEEEGMILVTKPRDKGKGQQATIRLADEWMPERDPAKGAIRAGGPLWAFAERISASRREGKNRRDGATVQSRVLGLADVVGASLWEDARVVVQGRDLEGEVLEKARAKAKRGSRRKTMSARL
jgi:hypothetical protein